MIIDEIPVDELIILKILSIEHSPLIHNAINENRMFFKKWLPFVEFTNNEKDTFAFVKSIVDDVERRQEIFTIWYNNEFAGLLGLKDIDYLNKKIELGYWLIEKHTQKGIMTLCVEKIINFIYENLEMNRIQIKCAVGNIASSAIPKRMGFTFEGIERNGEKHKTRFFDLEVYSMLKKEFII